MTPPLNVTLKAAAILESIYQMLLKSDREGYLKINNAEGAFMPLIVERLSPKDGKDVISLAHYFEVEGDLIPDPDMTFMRLAWDEMVPGVPKFIPLSFQDQFKYQESIVFDENDRIKGFYKNRQVEFVRFTSIWLNNIVSQQGIVPVKYKVEPKDTNPYRNLAKAADKVAAKLGFKNYSEAMNAGKGKELEEGLKEMGIA